MPQQSNWWFCQNCYGMFFAGYGGGRCPAGGPHSPAGLAFMLPYGVPETPTAQGNWRWCKNCHGMYFADYGGGRCPAGGSHTTDPDSLTFVLPHDVPETATAQGKWKWCKNCHGMVFDGYKGGRCPGGSGHSGDGFNFVLPHRAGFMLPGNKPPGRAGTKDPKAIFSAFITNANYYGMPVTFLNAVGTAYKLKVISEKEAEGFERSYKQMELHQSTYTVLANTNVDPPWAEGTMIDTLYHESTHAYLWLNKAAFSTQIAAGEKHYTGAPMVGGGTSKDPARVFTEAAGMYVGHRAGWWWNAFEGLTHALIAIATEDKKTPIGVTKSLAQKARDDYNTHMKERVFGYEEVGSAQVFTTRPISSAMKTFLDTEILEDKIPDNFDDVSKFAQMYRDVFNGAIPR